MKRILIFIILLVILSSSGQEYVNPGSILFYDQFNGTTINTAKWTVTNPNDTLINFSQDGALIVKHIGLGAATFNTNNIQSITTFNNNVVVRFSVNFAYYSGIAAYCGIYVDNNNRITLYAYSPPGKIDLYIHTGGTQRYYLANAFSYNEVVKIKISSGNIISFWVWRGSWVQAGTNQTWDIGAAKKVWAGVTGSTSANSIVKLFIDDVYVTDFDYNTSRP